MNAHARGQRDALIVGLVTTMLSFPAWAEDVATVLPEPGIMALLLGGVGAAVLCWRNRRK